MARTFSELRKEVAARPGAMARLAATRADTLEEIRLYELRHAEAVSQAQLAGRLDVTQGAISKLEHSDDVRVSTLRQYLEALGARLADRRMTIEVSDAALQYIAEQGFDPVYGPRPLRRFIAHEVETRIGRALLSATCATAPRSGSTGVGGAHRDLRQSAHRVRGRVRLWP